MAEDTTLISTPGRGNVDASFTGVAMSIVTLAVKELRNIPANEYSRFGTKQLYLKEQFESRFDFLGNI